MGFTRKEIILFISTFVASLLIVIFTFSYVKNSERYYDVAQKDMIKAISYLSSTDIYDEKAVDEILNKNVSKAFYGKKEKKAKEYLSLVNEIVKRLEVGIFDSDFSKMLLVKNLKNDQPDYNNSYKLINTTNEELDKILADYKEVYNEETARKYIKDEKIIEALNFDKEVAYMEQLTSDYKVYVSKTKDIVDFLHDNNEYVINNGKDITFTSNDALEKYIELVNALEEF